MRIAITTILILLATQSLGESKLDKQISTLQSCIDISNSNERLACYDKLAGYKSELDEFLKKLSVNKDYSKSKWSLVEQMDDFTDKDTSFMYLHSSVLSRQGADAPKTVFVRCDGKGSYDVYILSVGYWGGDKNVVRYRFDDEQAHQETWNGSTDGKAVFVKWIPGNFSRTLATGKSFILEVKDYRGSRSQARFHNNKDERLDKIYDGCKS